MAKIQEDVPDLVVGIDFGMTYTGRFLSSQLAEETDNCKALRGRTYTMQFNRLMTGRAWGTPTNRKSPQRLSTDQTTK
jgi:hypothetical protein